MNSGCTSRVVKNVGWFIIKLYFKIGNRAWALVLIKDMLIMLKLGDFIKKKIKKNILIDSEQI